MTQKDETFTDIKGNRWGLKNASRPAMRWSGDQRDWGITDVSLQTNVFLY